MNIDDPRDFGRVAVVMGGESAERSVSLNGGQDVLDALYRREVKAQAVDGVAALVERIHAGEVDRVFNILHGRGGEDGSLQGLLRSLGVPVTGAGVLGSAISMNKVLSKRLWLQAGLATAAFEVVEDLNGARAAAQAIGYPVVVKPVSEGSSVGVSIVREEADLDDAHAAARDAEARHSRPRVIIERYLAGEELAVGLLKGQALPAVRIEPSREFYDYAAKYENAGTRYHCPAGLDAAEEQSLQALALAAFEAVECRGWGRVDFIRDSDGSFQLIEANTTPGMTASSLVPKGAAAAGIGFDDLVWRILETSFEEMDQ